MFDRQSKNRHCLCLAAAVFIASAMPAQVAFCTDAINAHGGCWLEDGGRIWWYGEHKVEGTLGNTAQVGVHVYSREAGGGDWRDDGVCLAVEGEGSEIKKGCVIERPKVVKSAATGKYAMLFHLERKGLAYGDARVGFAVADSAKGPFKFVRSLRPNAGTWPQNGDAACETPEAMEQSRREEATIRGNGPDGGGRDALIYPAHFDGGQQSRDMTLFTDPADGKVYHIFASERNSTIHIAELTPDCLGYTGRWWRACEKDWTEAPCVWKHGDWYFMLGSGCTGWKPNEARYYRARSVTGPWERMGNPCVGTMNTWGGQSAFVFDDIAAFDVWCPTNAIAGKYLFKKISYPKDGEISIDTDWQAEIDALAASGGGTLAIPPGEHITGALFFKPGVKLHLEDGAVLKGSPEDSAYPMIPTRFEGRETRYPAALVNAEGCDGFSMTGNGTIDGNGEGWWRRFWQRRATDRYALNIDNPRPRLVQIARSKNVRLSGTTFKNSAAWTVHLWDCDGVTVEDCAFLSEPTEDGVRGPSTDGLDLDGVRGAVVRRCRFDVNDDAIAVKGGKGEGSHLIATRDILVEDCDFTGACHSALTLGSECPAADGVVMRNCLVDIKGNLLHEKFRWDTHQTYTNVTVEGVAGSWGNKHRITHYYGEADRIPDECRAKAWWFFGQTETTREGITADAEAFKRAGFGGVVYYDQYHGENPVADKLWSEAWWDGIEFAAAEAARLGLSFQTAVGNGYVAGGPWIDPAHSMKRLDCIERDVNGGKVKIPLPVAKDRGWQRTVAVLAIPLDEANEKFVDMEYAGHEKGLASTMQHPGGMYGYREKTFKAVTNSLPKIPCWQAKTAAVVDFVPDVADGCPIVPPAIDVTEHFDEKTFTLDCTLSAGRWKVIRFVAVPTGARTKHGRPDAMGLECDKMSEEAALLHWNSYAKKIIDRLRAKSLPLAGIVMDSHEAGAQNWTDDMLEEFARRRGYDLRPYLPLMAGYRVAENAEEILADFRKTCVELIAERYYGTFDRLCRDEGLSFTAQTGGGMFMIADSVFSKKHVQIPEGEFWAYQKYGAYDVKDCSSAAHLYGKKIASAEALTDASYKMPLAELRRRCDLAFAFGANSMTVCAVPHMPKADAAPKSPTGPREYGINRTNPWWDESRPFWDYIAFSSWMLRQGKPAPEALWHAGDKVPNKIIAAEVPTALHGLDWDFATSDAAARLAKTADAWTTPEGVRYAYVVDGEGRTLAGSPPPSRIALPHARRILPSGETLLFVANDGDQPARFDAGEAVVIDPWTRRQSVAKGAVEIPPGESRFAITGASSTRSAVVAKLSRDWEFSRNGEKPVRVSVPHDWAIAGPFNKTNDIQIVAIAEDGEKTANEKTGRTAALPWIGDGKYRREVEIPQGTQCAAVVFSGAMGEPQVFWDGAKVGEWKNGYTSFKVDLPDVSPGRHILEVRLHNRPMSSRWYPGAGLFRPVYLVLNSADAEETVFARPDRRARLPKIETTPEGFFINGEKVKFKGVCLHHDLGSIGAEWNTAAFRRQVRLLKEIGVNAIRTAHNQPSPEMLDVCDEEGMWVMAESFDCWKRPKVANGYNLWYREWWKKDLAQLVKVCRDHPCVVMYCIGNEISESVCPEGPAMVKEMQDLIHSLDPSRPCTLGNNRPLRAAERGTIAAQDIAGANYHIFEYEATRPFARNGTILGTETSSAISTRGFYRFPDDVRRYRDSPYDDGQVSSYDTDEIDWSNLADDDLAAQEDYPWTLGQFVWTGFDYLGEPSPYNLYWPSRSSYFGIYDLAGLPKDRAWLYRSVWRDDSRTLHILPHWTWPGREGKITPVYVYTDAPEAELFVNGASQGRVRKDSSTRLDRFRLRWRNVVYAPGELKATAYYPDGTTKTETVKTADEPARLRLSADRAQITLAEADGTSDLAYVTVEAVDENGTVCPHAALPLSFEIEGGAVAFKGVCNGDPTSLEVFTQPRMTTFHGALVVTLAAQSRGVSRLVVSTPGLPPASIEIGVAANNLTDNTNE